MDKINKDAVINQAERLYKKVNTFIISCKGEDGYPLTKAIVPGKHRESIKEMYFCTNSSSKFASSIASDNKASVYFYSRKLVWKGCYLKGTMEIVSDLSEKEKYWQNKFKNAYVEKSFTDPDYCVLKFTGVKGRLYSNYNSQDFEI